MSQTTVLIIDSWVHIHCRSDP